MSRTNDLKFVIAFAVCLGAVAHPALALEGRIQAMLCQGNETNILLYTVGTNRLRIEITATNSDESRAGRPNPVDIVDRQSGALTLLFPHNRSFVRVPAAARNPGATPDARATPMPPGGLPPGIGPQTAANMPGAPGMAGMPMMPMPMEKIELKATGETTNLLGFACARYEIKQRGETLEIWATDQLLPFQLYIRNQSRRFGPRMIDEQWPELLKARELFPLLATRRFEHGPEHYRFEVTKITPEKIADPDGKLFQPPPGYFETQPLP